MSLKELWHKITFIGIEDDQEFSHREVVLLNKIVLIGCLLFLPVVPLEVFLNGWKLVPYEILMFAACGITFFFNYKKWYEFAKIYFFFVIVGFIWFLGIAVGHGSGNEVTFFAVIIAPSMLLKNKNLIILLTIIAAASLVSLKFVQEAIPPTMDVPLSVREKFVTIFQVLISVIIFFQIYYFKGVNLKFQNIVLKKNEVIEEKNKEIVDSINYAKHIQSSYLPPKVVLSRFFEKSFLFFEPKDIISGDFYWFYNEKIEDKYSDEKFIVAADCTGHGVPGAIMSVICANALNDTIVTRKERDTGKILDMVRNNVVNILKGKDEQESRKDGMDVALVKINKATGDCQYSGAHNPLWVLRKDAEEFEVIKADKQPVGAYQNSQPFSSHDFKLSTGDRFYIFSDGFQDQFGGEKGKKFKVANMKRLFTSLKSKSMQDQKAIVSESFVKWKGDLEQVDDVVLIGIEF